MELMSNGVAGIAHVSSNLNDLSGHKQTGMQTVFLRKKKRQDSSVHVVRHSVVSQAVIIPHHASQQETRVSQFKLVFLHVSSSASQSLESFLEIQMFSRKLS